MASMLVFCEALMRHCPFYLTMLSKYSDSGFATKRAVRIAVPGDIPIEVYDHNARLYDWICVLRLPDSFLEHHLKRWR